jgi:four helix bundle protein
MACDGAGDREPGAGVRSYRDLRVWQNAIDLIPEIYILLKKLPKEENYALADQIRRAAVSVAANIAEGHARQHTREFLQHLSIARGSLAELETLLIIAEKLQYVSRSDLRDIEDRSRTVGMLLHGLTRRLRADPGPRAPDPAHGEPGGSP